MEYLLMLVICIFIEITLFSYPVFSGETEPIGNIYKQYIIYTYSLNIHTHMFIQVYES